MKTRLLLIALHVLVVSACQPQPVIVTVVVTPEIDIDSESLYSKDAIPSNKANIYAGQTVTIQIDHAYCSYRADIDGQPTFCNDAPYPNHDFTLLVWGFDWSEYDGHCLLVTGFISRYRGKPEIVAESRSQVSLCD